MPTIIASDADVILQPFIILLETFLQSVWSMTWWFYTTTPGLESITDWFFDVQPSSVLVWIALLHFVPSLWCTSIAEHRMFSHSSLQIISPTFYGLHYLFSWYYHMG
ncbi:MAG: hypothetical protein HKN85_07805, partial [Gammaproteobacteria bacterium]|nr:hypothetical protein [Gammaproteobacteria bacterium]